MNLSQLKANIEAIDHDEKVRHLEKTNVKPTDKSHIDSMKKKFRKRWSTTNKKLSANKKLSTNKTISITKESSEQSDIKAKENNQEKPEEKTQDTSTSQTS